MSTVNCQSTQPEARKYIYSNIVLNDGSSGTNYYVIECLLFYFISRLYSFTRVMNEVFT